MPEKQTLAQFGQTIKAKHPEYSDMSDEDVATKVLAKYPQYGDMVATSSPQQGFFGSFADSSGLTGLAHAVAHPIDTITGIPSAIAAGAKNALTEAHDEVNALRTNGLTQETRRKLGGDIPIVGPALATAQAQHDAGNNAGMAGTLAGTVAGLAAPGAIGEARAALPGAVRATSGAAVDMASAIKDKLYPAPKALPAPEMAARNLAKALVVPTQAVPNFVSAATPEAGNILSYAKRTGTPINSTIDFAKAAKGAADEVQGFFNDQVLKPNADLSVNTSNLDYRGKTTGSGRATLGQINDRINDINAELNPNYRKGLASQTSAANVSDGELLAEKRTLTNTLHQVLADATGVEPEDIGSLRQRAGKLRTIADEAQLSANTDTTAAGKAARGRSDIPTGTKLGMVERTLQAVRGGPEVIGNRAVKSALGDIQPTNTPFPDINNPNFVANRAAQTTANQAAAQQEFLRSHQLEQGAQDASQFRASQASGLRGDLNAAAQQGAQQEFLRSNQLEQGAQDAAAARSNVASGARADIMANKAGGKQLWAELGLAKVKTHLSRNLGDDLSFGDLYQIANTPQGRDLLIKASDLSPGSPAMKNLAKQISALAKASSRP